jgi:hypothetical protein
MMMVVEKVATFHHLPIARRARITRLLQAAAGLFRQLHPQGLFRQQGSLQGG